jgi:predicted MFS family arabinose efflux permease
LTVPVYAVAFITTIVSARLSDKYKTRSVFIIGHFSVAALGYIALMAIPHPKLPGLTYGMLFVVAIGLYPTIMGIVSWNGKSNLK